MLKRFLIRTVAFVALVVPGAFGLALLATPAYPAPVQADGCDSNLQQVEVSLSAAQDRVRQVAGAGVATLCSVNQHYFMELVKARAVAAWCHQSRERERALGRLDADVAHINSNIAAMCD